ncbi:HNH endonuclease family protein [Streptomyces sp. CRN 30]|uniref:HNH endonuclease family protein n=1 Tax=Streptomyces sp. CRN 30 TaxID=3075613 RepID=UPI002A82606B|nr:HNH endonuclease family protein [Streptomyces sp. CRN 30]
MRKFYARRRLSVLAAATGLAAMTGLFSAPNAAAALPTPVSAATARTYLASLTVATENRTGYNRDLFPHWITVSGTCNTRETVLKRDGSNVVTDSACASTSGSWYSPYDGATWTAASDVDIDHVVPLAEAWDSGASSWTTSRRQSFANDLTRPQLIAVTDNVNQSKGDKDPAEWMPSRTAYRCTYVRAWVQVKHYYGLSVDSAEKSALTNYLSAC